MVESIGIEDATALVANVFIARGTSPGNALCTARALVAAEVDGQIGHGLNRVPTYAAQLESGKVDGQAEPKLEAVRPGFLRIDAAHGFAFPAMEVAVDAVSTAAAANGIAAAAVFNSHHCGQAGYHVERLAERGCIAFLFANTPKAMAPWGGREPLFGTNPIAFGAPLPDREPLVIDLSLSKVARGKVLAARNRGEPIPEGWALDPQGQPTTDPQDALDGTMVPMGDAKGAALALMVEILSAAMTGALFSFEASSFLDTEGPPPSTGQMLIAIDMRASIGPVFLDRMGALVAAIEAQEGARLPGTSRLARRESAAGKGLAVDPNLMESLRELASG